LDERNPVSNKKKSELRFQLQSDLTIALNIFHTGKHQRHLDTKIDVLNKIIDVKKQKETDIVKKAKFITKIGIRINWANSTCEIIKQATLMYKNFISQMLGLKSKIKLVEKHLISIFTENHYLNSYRSLLEIRIKKVEKQINLLATASMRCLENFVSLHKTMIINDCYKNRRKHSNVRSVRCLTQQVLMMTVRNNQDWRNLINEYYRLRIQV